MKPSPWLGLHFRTAIEAWVKTQWGQLSPRTMLDFSYYIPILAENFAQICEQRDFPYPQLYIEVLDNEWMRDYQDHRIAKAAPDTVNKELSVITHVRDEMRMTITGYKRLKKKKGWRSPGRKLTLHEYRALVRVCRAHINHKKWGVAALCTLVSLDSGMGPGEIKTLMLRDITVGKGTKAYPWMAYVAPLGAKRKRRERNVTFVVGSHGEWALEKLLERAHALGATEDDHFLLPKEIKAGKRGYDPTDHVDNWKFAWRSLLVMAGIKRFRMYDCRHHAISEALSRRGPDCISFAAASGHFGHISEQMRSTYFHGDIESSYQVAEAISGRRTHIEEDEKQEPKKPARRVNGNGTQPEQDYSWVHGDDFSGTVTLGLWKSGQKNNRKTS